MLHPKKDILSAGRPKDVSNPRGCELRNIGTWLWTLLSAQFFQRVHLPSNVGFVFEVVLSSACIITHNVIHKYEL